MEATITTTNDPTKIVKNTFKQIRFAAKQTLRDTGLGMRDEAARLATEHFDTPVARTKKPAYFTMERKTGEWTTLKAEVGLKNKLQGINPDKYLRFQIKGGQRRDKRLEVALRSITVTTKKHGTMKVLPDGYQVVVHSQFTNSKGNITGNRSKEIINQMKMNGRGKQYFLIHPHFNKVGGSGMTPGVYIRQGKKLKIVLIFVGQEDISYKIGYPFYRRMNKMKDIKWKKFYKKNLRNALKTARI